MSRFFSLNVRKPLLILPGLVGVALMAHVCSAEEVSVFPSTDGLLAWYDASDANSMEIQGQEVVVWGDKSSHGFDLKKKAAVAGPTLHSEDASGFVSGGVLVSAGVNQVSDALTVYAVAKTEPGNAPILAFSDSAGPDACVAGWTTGAAPGFLSASGHAQASAEVEDGQWHLLTFWRQGVLRRFYVDGVLAGESTAGSAPTLLNDLLLFEYPGAATFRGELAELLVYTIAQSEPDIDKTCAGMREKWNKLLPDPAGDLLVFVGNSITTGMFCGNGKTWSRQASDKTPGARSWYNISKGGVTTQQLNEMAGTNVDPLLALRTGKSTLVFWEGTNDLVVNQASAADAATRVGEFCAARKKAGWDNVVVLNVLPREAGPGFESQRQELNRLLSAKPASFSIDALVDLAAIPEIGAPGAEGNKTYFVDGVHLNAAGQCLVAGAVVPVLESLKK